MQTFNVLYGIFFSSLKIVIVGSLCYFNVEIPWSQKPLLDLVHIMMGWGEDIGNTSILCTLKRTHNEFNKYMHPSNII